MERRWAKVCSEFVPILKNKALWGGKVGCDVTHMYTFEMSLWLKRFSLGS
jgi:hypothetical protein